MIERKRGDERRGLEAARVQLGGERRHVWPTRAGRCRARRGRRIAAGEQRRVRRQRDRRGGVGALEGGAALREPVERRRPRPRVAVGADVVGAQRVDGDQHDRFRARRASTPACVGRMHGATSIANTHENGRCRCTTIALSARTRDRCDTLDAFIAPLRSAASSFAAASRSRAVRRRRRARAGTRRRRACVCPLCCSAIPRLRRASTRSGAAAIARSNQRHRLAGPVRLDEQHAEAVGGVRRARVDFERAAVRLLGAGAIAGRAARVAEVRPVRRVVRSRAPRPARTRLTASAALTVVDREQAEAVERRRTVRARAPARPDRRASPRRAATRRAAPARAPRRLARRHREIVQQRRVGRPARRRVRDTRPARRRLSPPSFSARA